jgi:hypothetical protein
MSATVGRRPIFAASFAAMLCGSAAEAQPRQWSLDRIGSTAADLDVGWIASVAAARSGTFYVADFGAQQIVVYDSVGRRTATIGRKGEGPLEFTRLLHLAWLGDTLVAYDSRSLRLTFIHPNGTLLRSAGWPASTGRPSMFFGAGGSALHALVYGKRSYVPIAGTNGGQTVHLEQQFASIGSMGSASVVRTVRDSSRESSGFDCWHDPAREIAILSTVPGAPGPMKAFTATAFVAASRDRSRVEWFDGTGALRQATPPYPSVAVTDALWRREAREYFDTERRLGSLTCSPTFRRPETLPAIRALVADDDGNVWVEITTAAGIRLDVYDPSAKLVGTMPAPARDQSSRFVVRGGRLYVVEIDRDDVRSVGVFRVRR